MDGSEKMPDDLMESIEPFDFSEAVDFQTAYLAGYLADKYDVDAKAAEGRAKERLYNTAEHVLRRTVQGYQSVTVRRRHLASQNGKVLYALLLYCLSGCSRRCIGGRSISLPLTDRPGRW